MHDGGDRRGLWALYLTRFAVGFGLATLAVLLPEYIDRFQPSGLVLGLFYAGFTLTQLVAVFPVAVAGDRFDKRTILLVGLSVGFASYVAFGLVAAAGHVIAARALQGVSFTTTGILTLALIGELAPPGETATRIGRANAFRLAAGVGGALLGGLLFERFGYVTVHAVLGGLVAIALAAVVLFVDPEPPDDRVALGNGAGGLRTIPAAIREIVASWLPIVAGLARNPRLRTLTTFRAPYAVAVTLTRNWVPVFAGIAANGGLAYGATAVGVVFVAEKATNMALQPFTGGLSDRYGRALFVFAGGGTYGLVALAVPLTPVLGVALGLPSAYPLLGPLSPAFLPLVALNALLGVADSVREPASMALFADEGSEAGGIASSFGIRELIWRPGSILAPLAAGVLTTSVGVQWVFVGGGLSALVAAAAFVAVLRWNHGPGALVEW